MKKEIKRDELLGAVKFQSQWRFFAEYHAWWILDYVAYSPSILRDKDRQDFRNGLLVVNTTNGKEFLQAMSDQEISFEDLKGLVTDRGIEEIPLNYVVNFDEHIFVDGYSELDVEEYVPANWEGIKDFPLNYVPDEIRSVWATRQTNMEAK